MSPFLKALALAGLLQAGDSGFAQSFPGYYEIVNAQSGLVLESPVSPVANNSGLDQRSGNGGANQQWSLSSASGGAWVIRNRSSGLALQAQEPSSSSAASVELQPLSGAANQEWTLTNLSRDVYEIVNKNSGLALAGPEGDYSVGGRIDQSSWKSGAHQEWLLLPVGETRTVSPPSGGSGAPASTFHGFNWADPRDNFVDGPLLLSGLAITNTYSDVLAISSNILAAFALAGANTVRVPINPETVLGSWWSSYRGVIDEGANLGMKMIVCPWTSMSQKNGRINDPTCFWRMWDNVVTAYNGNSNVYFEILNEPFGYNAADWLNVVSSWLRRYPTVARGRILVGGTNYDNDIPAVATSPITAGCLYSVHVYGFYDNRQASHANWFARLANEVGSFARSTVLTEFGAPMTARYNYAGGDQNNNYLSSMIGFAAYCASNRMGAVYWPGLRDRDTYSMFSRVRNSTTLAVNNPSGMDLLRYAWSGFDGAGTYQILNGRTGIALDFPSSPPTNANGLVQPIPAAGQFPQWTLSILADGSCEILNPAAGLALGVAGGSTNEGAALELRGWNGAAEQRWGVSYLDNGFYQITNRHSGLALEVSPDSGNGGGNLVQRSWNGGANQEWTFGNLPAPLPPSRAGPQSGPK